MLENNKKNKLMTFSIIVLIVSAVLSAFTVYYLKEKNIELGQKVSKIQEEKSTLEDNLSEIKEKISEKEERIENIKSKLETNKK